MSSSAATPGSRSALPRVLTAAILIAITCVAAWRVHVVIERHQQARIDAEARRIESAVAQRMTAYVQVLRGGLGLFDVQGEVTLAEWARYVDNLELDRRYPGFKSLSFAAAVAPADLDDFVAEVRAGPVPPAMERPALLRAFTVRSPVATSSAPEVHAVIVFVAPLIPENERVLGVDMMQEATRRAAMERAAAGDDAALSPRLQLAGQGDQKVGFIAYLAVRRGGELRGWLTAAFRAEDFMGGLLGDGASTLDFEVYDGPQATPAGLLYSTAGIAETGLPRALSGAIEPERVHLGRVELPGRTWSIRYVAGPGFTPATDRLAPWLILISGLLAAALFSATSRAGARLRIAHDQVADHNEQLRREVAERQRVEGALVVANQALDAASRAKDVFLATMSHEIRTPMNAVIGMTAILRDTALDAEQREYLEIVRVSGEHLLMLINDVLDFSKIEAGKLELEEIAFGLRECVEGALDLVAPRAAEKGVELVLEARGELPAALVGDVGRVRQVLLNLLSNAVKFTERGEVVVELSASPRGDGRLLVEAAVRDTGVGIPEDKLGRLFHSFSQVDASTTRRHGGTGLGLVISRRLAEHMGGTITVTSESGVGSVFRFTFVVPEAPASASAPAETPRLAAPTRALVVDDNHASLRALAAQVSALGAEVRASASPEEALAWVGGGERFDVAILDAEAQVSDGRTLAAALGEAHGAPAPALILLASLKASRGAAKAGGGAAAAILHKPVKQAQLVAALTSARSTTASPASPAAAGARAADPPARAPALRILMAEDNPFNQRVGTLTLGKLGQSCDLAGDGRAAIDALRERDYAVVFMDMHMPELDGIEATREIRATLPAARQPYIIALTANALQGDRDLCMAAGMDDYLSKPIRQEEVAAALLRAAARLQELGRLGTA